MNDNHLHRVARDEITEELTALFSLNKQERIDYGKSVGWESKNTRYYFFAISRKIDSDCRFVFVNATDSLLVSDGGFYFEHCEFSGDPEFIDVNKDGALDFRVNMKLPHPSNQNVLVDHYLDFVYDEENGMYCERTMRVPCDP